MNLIQRLPDGKLTLSGAVIFSCGCSGTIPDAKNKVRMAGVPDVPVLMTTTNDRVRQYIRQVGLDKLAPSLRRSTHSVLYNPFTGKFIDLKGAPKTDQLYKNIYEVASGTN